MASSNQSNQCSWTRFCFLLTSWTAECLSETLPTSCILLIDDVFYHLCLLIDDVIYIKSTSRTSHYWSHWSHASRASPNGIEINAHKWRIMILSDITCFRRLISSFVSICYSISLRSYHRCFLSQPVSLDKVERHLFVKLIMWSLRICADIADHAQNAWRSCVHARWIVETGLQTLSQSLTEHTSICIRHFISMRGRLHLVMVQYAWSLH